jgi:hypothetical protein
MEYIGIPEKVISSPDFKLLENAYRAYEANNTIKNAAKFVEEARAVSVKAEAEGFKVNSPFDTINKAIVDREGNSGYNEQEAKADEGYSRYLKMRDEVETANKSGMSMREFAESKGVKSTLTDEEATALDRYYYRSKLEGEGKGNVDTAQKVDHLNQFAADNKAYNLQLSTEEILKQAGGRTDLAEKLILATKEIIRGKTVPEVYEIQNIPDNPEPCSLSMYKARVWYLYQESLIGSRLDTSKPLEQQARDACYMRNEYRTRARENMSDRDWAEYLTENDKNKTFEEQVEYYSKKGFIGDALWEEIIKASMRSRNKVNDLFGIIVGGY